MRKEELEKALDRASRELTINQLLVRDLALGRKPDATATADCGEGETLTFTLYRATGGHGGLLVVSDGHSADGHYFEDYKRQWDADTAQLGGWRHAVADALAKLWRVRGELFERERVHP